MENLTIITAIVAFFGAVGWAFYFYEREKNERLMEDIKSFTDRVEKIERENQKRIDFVITEICKALGDEERAIMIQEKVNRMFDRLEKEEGDEANG